jgi:uncharacterized protein
MGTSLPPVSVPPSTWLLIGEKPGDNAQVQVLADALGWPCEVRRLYMRPEWVLGKPRVRATLDHVDPARSDALEPPWPDLLVTAGRRLSSAALWVRQQSRGRTRLVLIGKPRQRRREFDLVVASAQYRVPSGRKVVRIGLPLMRLDPAVVSAAAEAWRARFAKLPRPLVALLVGGPTKPVRFDAAVARDMTRRTAADAAAAGGSLYICTSRRTPAAVLEAIAATLPSGATLHRWRPHDPENPYLALLGLADRFVVTSDSVSMMVEVVRLGKPLAVYRLPPRRRLLRVLTRSRDLDAVVRLLLREGLAVLLGAPWRPQSETPPDDLPHVVERVRALAETH